MGKVRQLNVTLIIVVALLLVAYIDSFLWWNFRIGHIFLTFLRVSIHIGLLLYWTLSIHRRIIHKEVRRYSIYIALLMVFWISVKALKYHVVPDTSDFKRWLWYSYYLPLLFIPTLGVLVALSMGKAESYRLPKQMKVMIICASLLLLLVFTNDYHHLVFHFPEGEQLADDVYTYSGAFWLLLGWEIFTAIFALSILIVKCRLPRARTVLWLPLLPLSLAISYSLLYTLRYPPIRLILGDMTVTLCIFIVALWESSVKTGLIQANTNYGSLLHASTIGAQITDGDYNVIYASENALTFQREELASATEGDVLYWDRGLRLSGSPIREGYVFWQEDVSDLMAVVRELESTGVELQSYGELLQEESRQKERQSKLEEEKRLFDLMRVITQPQTEEITRLTEKLLLAEDEDEAHKLLARTSVLGAYLKRRSNLIFLADEAGIHASEELRLCLEESLESLRLCSIGCALSFERVEQLALDQAILFYDFFEAAVELSLDRLTDLVLSLQGRADSLSFSLMLATEADMRGLKERFKESSIEREDGICYLGLTVPKGGGRR